MQRYFIRLSYKGTHYHGWQLQPNATTVQQVMGEALKLILQQLTELTGCGRTDTGVHAEMFFAHFETTKKLSAEALLKLCNKLNALLTDDILINEIFCVAPDTHARFSAIARTYEYRIIQHKHPFLQELACHFSRPLDVAMMNRCASIIMEYRDFSCFSKAHTQTFTNDCKITEAYWEEKNQVLVFKITADRFLRNMVRAIVGTLIEAGLGKITEADIRKIIQSGKRGNAGKSMPACGLFLTEVRYPEGLLIYNQD